MKLSKRLDQLTSAVFSEVALWKREGKERGVDVIDLSVGSPDLPPPMAVKVALAEAVRKNANYGYPLMEGSMPFNQAAADWYRARFQVELDPAKEVLPLMGSQDGLAHLALALIDPGDIVLLPDPGYPVYEAGAVLAGAEIFRMPLRENNDYLPDFDRIPAEVASRAKLMVLNYPSNPLSAVADLPFFEKVVDYARKNEIFVAHDVAYSELAFDGFRPPSFLQATGAKNVGVEFNSLSKSFNMAGCRIAYMAGNQDIVSALDAIKSNIDYGVFLAVQEAGIVALRNDIARLNAAYAAPDSAASSSAAVYQSRRDVLIDGLADIGWPIRRPKATMFVWAQVPKGWKSRQFSREIFRQTGVVVIPGDAFGSQGEGYVRMALVQDEPLLREAVRRIAESGILRRQPGENGF